MKTAWIALVAALGLAACGEKPQVMESSRRDTPAYTGTGMAFSNKDWKAGDSKSWESQLKARGQYGQNDYTRMH